MDELNSALKKVNDWFNGKVGVDVADDAMRIIIGALSKANKTGYENMTLRQLETLVCAHVDIDELNKNDAYILGMQLIEWSRR